MSWRCHTCQHLIDDDRLIACPRCHNPLSTPTQAPELSQEQLDRLADRLRGPVTCGILKSFWIVACFVSLLLALLGASYVTIRNRVNELVSQKFAEPYVRETFQDVAKTRASEMLTNEIQPEVTRFYDETTKQVQNFQGFLDNLKSDFQNQYQTLSEEVSRLKKRNDLTVLGDRAISDGDSEALDELQILSKDSADLTTKAAAIAEYRRVVSFWTLMSRTDSGSFTVTSKDGTTKKDQENSTSDLVLYAISDPHLEIRAISARLLGQRRETGAPEALLHLARTDKHLEVRKYATESFKSVTGSGVRGVFNVDGFEKWWKEYSAEVNEGLTEMK